MLVALVEHAARFRNIYFPLTASDSLPGRPRHGEQVDLASVFVSEIRDRSPTSSARVFRSESREVKVYVCVSACICYVPVLIFFKFLKRNLKYLSRKYLSRFYKTT